MISVTIKNNPDNPTPKNAILVSSMITRSLTGKPAFTYEHDYDANLLTEVCGAEVGFITSSYTVNSLIDTLFSLVKTDDE